MVEYALGFLLLFVVVMTAYLAYERFVHKDKKSESALYVEALRDLLDGRQEAAFGKLRQVVAEDSSNLDAYLRLGQILRENHKADRALQVHKDLTIRVDLSSEQKYEILRQLYLDYSALEDNDQAAAALREMISIHADSRWAFVHLLKLQEDLSQWEEAYETAVSLLKLESNKSRKPLARFKYRLGDEMYKKREYHKARILFKEAIGLDPQYVTAYLAIGDSYADESRHEDAVNFWNKLIEAVPAKGHLVLDRLQKVLFDLGRFGDIADVCQGILDHSPQNNAARLTLAMFYEKKGDLDASIEILTQLVDDSSSDVVAMLELLRIYAEKNDQSRLLGQIKQLIRKHEHSSTTARAPQSSTGSPVNN